MWMRVLSCGAFLLFAMASPLLAESCAATPEAAARSAVGSTMTLTEETAGYRAEAVQFDPVLHRVWVRVVHCGNPGAPAVLVPIAMPLRLAAADAHVMGTSPLPSSSAALETAFKRSAPSPVLVHFGDTVRAVFVSQAVRMELDAVAKEQGRDGETIALTLKRRSDESLDEPEHRIHGIVRANRTVEVTP